MDGVRSMRQVSQAGGDGGAGQYGYTTYPPPQMPQQRLPPQAGIGAGGGGGRASSAGPRRAASSATGYSTRGLGYFVDRAAPRSNVTFGKFDLSCCTCGCWRCLPNGPLLLFMSLLVTTAYILSVFSIYSCRFFYRICYDGTNSQVSCEVDAVFENELHMDGYRYGLVSYLPAQYTNNGTDSGLFGQCEFYPNEFQAEHTDSKFTMGKYFALFVLVCGGFATISMALKLCITARRGQFLCAGIYLLLVFFFQSMSFIILASEYCIDPPTSNSDEFYPRCYIDTAAKYTIDTSCCWFASSMFCILYRELSPSMRERKSRREMERIADGERAARKNREKVIKQQQKESELAEKERIALVEAAELERQRVAALNDQAGADGDGDFDDLNAQGEPDIPVYPRDDEELGGQQQHQFQQQQSQVQSQAPSSRNSRRLRNNQANSRASGGASVVSSLDEESKYDEDERMKRMSNMAPQSRPNVAANQIL